MAKRRFCPGRPDWRFICWRCSALGAFLLLSEGARLRAFHAVLRHGVSGNTCSRFRRGDALAGAYVFPFGKALARFRGWRTNYALSASTGRSGPCGGVAFRAVRHVLALAAFSQPIGTLPLLTHEEIRVIESWSTGAAVKPLQQIFILLLICC